MPTKRKFNGHNSNNPNGTEGAMQQETLWDAGVFTCPITLLRMTDPVICSDGFTYERTAIEEWLKAHSRSPSTNGALPSKVLIPNQALKRAISSYTTNLMLYRQQEQQHQQEKSRKKNKKKRSCEKDVHDDIHMGADDIARGIWGVSMLGQEDLPSEEPGMHFVHVKTIVNKVLTFQVSLIKTTVGDLKRLIQRQEGIKVDTQQLIFGGKLLSTSKTLAECGITSRAVLHLILRLTGG